MFRLPDITSGNRMAIQLPDEMSSNRMVPVTEGPLTECRLYNAALKENTTLHDECHIIFLLTWDSPCGTHLTDHLDYGLLHVSEAHCGCSSFHE